MIKCALFDFDGTISTLRCGWEQVMRPLMLEYIADAYKDDVDSYIDRSTGIQTIYQMQYLAEHARAGVPKDPWFYKDEYNARLMRQVNERLQSLEDGSTAREDYLVAGIIPFLQTLRERKIRILVASGTDHPDVLREAKALQVYTFFDTLQGAPVRQMRCSKEQVLQELIAKDKLSGEEIAVIGDGKVEIALGKAIGAITIGIASDEIARQGINTVKEKRLRDAGAQYIFGDFLHTDALLACMVMHKYA